MSRTRSRRAGSALAALLVLFGLFALGGLALGGWNAWEAIEGGAQARAAAAPRLVGINLAGAEFGPAGIGTYGQDYSYPDAETGAPFLAAGMNTARLPVRWERIQRAPFAPLDPAEAARLDDAIAALSGFRAIVLDIHNYAQYRGTRLDGSPASAAMLADLWTKLARRYGRNPRLVYGLMNEPVDVPAPAWRRIAEASVRAIRATGARGLILVPGTNWTGAHSWTSGGDAASNAAAFTGFRDANFAYDMHQYFDADSSGTHEACVSPDTAQDKLAAATTWLRGSGQRGFLGEFGVARNPACLAVLERVMTFLDANADVWMGWTVWAAGDRWGDNAFSVQPDDNGLPRPQMRVLERHLSRR